MVAAVGKANVLIQGQDGEVIFDSAADEFTAAKSLADRAAHNVRLQRMLDDMQRFYGDPEKKLAPLYDVLQAVETQFHGRDNVAPALKISAKDVQDLGRICNNRDIFNARHPGKGTSPKRPATAQELELCERVAETIIDRFAGTV